ncbi:MAG TPA: amidohydrolase family protein [Candidatus Limnocylindrales bacterium]|nr:amidohydrolase family protein [Candidatus Limnocylindrales bacterium]
MIVDAHHHFWDPARAEYPWLSEELAAIRRAFTPDDLAPLIAAAGVEATVLVQTHSSLDETRDFLATAAATPFIRGVVGWADLTDPRVADVLADVRDGPGGDRLVGIRHQVHDEPDPAWLLRPDVERGLRAVRDAGLTYDLLVRSRELPAAIEVVRQIPNLRFVIDHLAKPSIRDRVIQPWADLIRPFAALDNVWCKVSGMVTEADWTSWQPSDLAPYVEHVLDVFGPGRLVFGSDWPVCLLAASYEEVLQTTRTLLADLGEAERSAVFGGTARTVYRL